MTMLASVRENLDDYVRKNRKSSMLFKDAVIGKEKDAPVSYPKIMKNCLGIILDNHYVKILTPLFAGLAWNFFSALLPDNYVLSISWLILFAKNIALLTIWQRIKGEIDATENTSPEMRRIITVEKTEWNDSGNLETFQESQKTADYDKEQLDSFLQQQLFGTGIALLIHTIFGYTTPLVIAAVIGGTHLKDHPLTRIYINEESGEDHPVLVRPWKLRDFSSEWKRNMQQAQAIQNQAFPTNTPKENKDKKMSAKSLKKAEKATKAAEKKKR